MGVEENSKDFVCPTAVAVGGHDLPIKPHF